MARTGHRSWPERGEAGSLRTSAPVPRAGVIAEGEASTLADVLIDRIKGDAAKAREVSLFPEWYVPALGFEVDAAGFLPAWRASRLSPVEALRQE